MLNIDDPLDIAQMRYRVTQIEEKYGRVLYGLIVVDAYKSHHDESIPKSQWMKQKKLRRKLYGEDNKTISLREKEELFHLNTNNQFDIQHIHDSYRNVFEGPLRLVQVSLELPWCNGSLNLNNRILMLLKGFL